MTTETYSLIEGLPNDLGERYTITYVPTRTFTTRGVTVQQYKPADDLSWQTFSLLTQGFDLTNPGDDDVLTDYFKAVFRKPRLFNLGTVYANPCAVVRASHPSDRFLAMARRFQKEWFLCNNDILHSPARVRRRMTMENGIIRQLKYTGVLVIDNRHVFPDRWPDAVPGGGKDRRRTGQPRTQETIHPEEQIPGPRDTRSSEAAFRQRDTSGVLPSLLAASDGSQVVI